MTGSVCLFCSSSEHIPLAWREAARELGEGLAIRGMTLVYGGTTVGLMGEAARSARDHGGRVVGVIPKVIADAGVANKECDELVLSSDLRERKAIMDEHAEAFVVLPGGLGTFEELLEVLTLQQLGVRPRPIVLVNLDGSFDSFHGLLRDMVKRNLAETWVFELFATCTSVSAVFDLLESWDNKALPTKFPRN